MTKPIEVELTSYEKEAKHEEWKNVMKEEYESIMNKDGWETFPIRKDKIVVTSKWVYKINLVVYGRTDKYKARFVAKGFSQQEGINYEETSAPTARYNTTRSLISIVATMG